MTQTKGENTTSFGSQKFCKYIEKEICSDTKFWPVYETGISYQNTDGAVPYSGHRPGTDPFYPAPHQNNNRTVPMVTVTTVAKEARLEFVE